MENTTVLERQTLCSYKNLKLKVKLMNRSLQKKKEDILCTIYFARKNFFNICILCQCAVC